MHCGKLMLTYPVDLLSNASKGSNREITVGSDLVALESALKQVMGMLERVSKYVQEVTEGSRTGNPVIGRLLMEVLSGIPDVNKTEIEDMFNTHLQVSADDDTLPKIQFANDMQDVLMTTYLSNLIRTQLEIGARLNLLT